MARVREQNALVRYLHSLVDEIIAVPTFSRNDAVQFLRSKTVGIDQAEAQLYYETLATNYAAIGAIPAPATYNSWRDNVVAQGETKSKAMVQHIHRQLMEHAIMAKVNRALNKQWRQDSLDEADAEIAHLEAIQAASADQILIDALEFTLIAYRSRTDVERGRSRNQP